MCWIPLRLVRARTIVSLVAAAALSPAPADAASALVFSPPPALEAIPAGTYDDDGKRIGEASLYWEQMDDGTIHMRAVTAMTDGPRNIVNAFFAEINDGRNLRVLREDSLSHDAEGNPMVFVEVDHEKGEARCTPPGKTAAEADVVELPAEDRVANTTMSLLFQPLVRGEKKRVHFQAFLCSGGARLMDFVALRSKNDSQPPQVIEVRFGPDLGRMMSWLASVVVPKLRFWFEAEEGHYLAHRMPLYGGGPEVVVAREGVSAGFRQP
jgi:hypothetical protein